VSYPADFLTIQDAVIAKLRLDTVAHRGMRVGRSPSKSNGHERSSETRRT